MLENHGFLQKGLSVTVIPSANPFSMNIGKRFWAMDDTDINRMFPGYNKGETTHRIAAGLFEKLQDGFFLYAWRIYPSCKNCQNRFGLC